MSSSLELCQVLEEEYLNLHGTLRYTEPITLPVYPHNITPRLDWDFDKGHIKDAKAFRRRLRASATLNTYLRGRSNELDKELRDPEQRDPEQRDAGLPDPPKKDEASLIVALNTLLSVRNLYDEQKCGAASERVREILRCFDSTIEPLTDDEQRHFNRLLLEAWFPHDLNFAHDIRLAALYAQVHRKQIVQRDGPTALCLSGGGIRSGTFALGLMQGFAQHKLLEKFDYLSTVSGGGYIGSWLTAWINRDPGGMRKVMDQLKNSSPHTKIDPEPETLRYLRTYSNFLTPKVGLLTADTWTFIGIYLRNLLLNWTVLIPLMLAVLALPRLVIAMLRRDAITFPDALTGRLGALLGEQTTNAVVYAHELLRLNLKGILLLIGSVLGIMTVIYASLNRPGVSAQLQERRPYWYARRDQRSFLRWCLLPLIGSVAALAIYWAWTLAEVSNLNDLNFHYHLEIFGHSVFDFHLAPLAAFMLFATLLHLGGWAGYMLMLNRMSHANAKEARWSEFFLVAVTGVTGGFAAWFVATKLLPDPTQPGAASNYATEIYACFAVPSLLLIFTLAGIVFIAISSRFSWIEDEDREWWTRFGAWILIAIVAWVAFSTLVIFGPLLLLNNTKPFLREITVSVGGISGLIALLVGWSAKTPANDEQKKGKGGRLAALGSSLLPLLALLFLCLLLMTFSLLTGKLLLWLAQLLTLAANTLLPWLVKEFPEVVFDAFARKSASDELEFVRQNLDARTHTDIVLQATFWFVLLFTCVAALVTYIAAWTINLNKFSLHGGYRNRLIRTFLGASHIGDERKPNPFTGFDPTDNIRMHEMRPTLFHEPDFADLHALVFKVRNGDDPTSRQIAKYLAKVAPDTIDELKKLNDEEKLERAFGNKFIEGLNRILEDDEINFEPLPDAPPQSPFNENEQDAGIQSVGTQGNETQDKVSLASSDRKTRGRARVAPPVVSHASMMRKREHLQSVYSEEINAKYPPPHRLFHVVNMALNLVGGKNLAWQQRRATSFTATPLHAGCYRLGYRKAKDYGGPRGISLGTAATISGAAASSNMGYYTTSPILSLVMTFFNVRLGWWLGNPGAAGNETYTRAHPKLSVAPVIAEAFGMTDDESPYVYLSDGGHFENLALYEMVLRRCHTIIVSDGAQDADYEFGDLGNAVRKIRIDLGVPVEFVKFPDYADKALAGVYWGVAKIKYSAIDERVKVTTTTIDGKLTTADKDVPDATLIYVKPAIFGTEPRDVLQYKKAHTAFPHESTGDQFFDEPQFESYRALGAHVAAKIHEAVARQTSKDEELGNLHSYFAKL